MTEDTKNEDDIPFGPFTPLCWEDGPMQIDGMPLHCILPADHKGEHRWARDDEMQILIKSQS